MSFVSVQRNAGSAEFFDAAARRVLLLRRCGTCGHVRAARRSTCRTCGSSDASWFEASGEATLVTWARHAGKDAEAGWLFGLVELAEGPWLEATIVELPEERLAVGAALTARFVSGEIGDAYPVFRPADSGAVSQ